MRFFYLLLAAAIGLPSPTLWGQIGPLLWSDEFNTFDDGVWNRIQGDGCAIGLCGWGNAELQSYEPGNLSIAPVPGETGNSALVLEARRQNSGTRAFTSGKVDSEGKLSVQYGMIEIRMRVPDLNTGLWPAAWLLGTANLTWPAKGEIDMMEMGHSAAAKEREGYAGVSSNRFVGANAIFPADDGSAASIAYDVNYSTPYVAATSMADRFVTYRLYWEPSQMRYTVIDNGQEYDLYTNPLPLDPDGGTGVFTKPFYFLLNLAVGGNFTDALTNGAVTAPLPAKMHVDYVRVYEYNGHGKVESNYGDLAQETGVFGVYTEETPVNNSLTFGEDAEIFVWGNTLLEGATTPAAEGTEALNWVTTEAGWFGAGIVATFGKDMSGYVDEGVLRFRMRAPNNFAFRIGILDNYTNEEWIEFPAGVNQYGLVRGNGWSQVEIPLSDFAGLLAFQDLGYLFAISSVAGAVPPAGTAFSLDDIVYDDGTGATGGGGGGGDESFSLRIEAEDYTAMSGVQLEATTDVDGVENVGYIDANDWMEYGVDLPAAGDYALTFRVASQPGGAAVRIATNGVEVGTFQVGATGGWQAWQDVTVTATLPAGSQTIRLTSLANNWNLNWLAINSDGGGGSTNEPYFARIEAEAYAAMNGIQLEATSDVDGIQNVGWIDPNDWMEYALDLPAAGPYTLDLRVASAPGGANALVATNGVTVGSFSVDATGGWQSWRNVQLTVDLPAGPQTLRITSQAASWNLNWFSVGTAGSTSARTAELGDPVIRPARSEIDVFPNPVRDRLEFRVADGAGSSPLSARILDLSGRTLLTRTDLNPAGGTLDVSGLRAGVYLLSVRCEDESGRKSVVRFVVH